MVRGAADLTDIAPTLLHLLGLETAGCEGRVLRVAWGEAPDEPPEEEVLPLPRGFALERLRQENRAYPTGLVRAG